MTITFFAGPEDLTLVAEGLFAIPGLTAFEAYSEIGAEPRSFSSATDLFAALSKQAPAHLVLWWKSAMPHPVTRRFRLTSGGERSTVEGCGLFSFLAGTATSNVLTPTSISWFTEAGARAKCGVLPGPASVDWPVHRRVGGQVTRLVRSRLAVAHVPGRPILPQALALANSGFALKDSAGTPWHYPIGAT
jgi:hypothetical protein